MENADNSQDTQWVDERMAALLHPQPWQPPTEWESMRLSFLNRDAATRRRKRIAASVTVSAIILALAFPIVRGVGSRFVDSKALLPFDALAVGERIPDFVFTDPDGNKVKLSDYQGDLIFLNFWAPWCLPCATEMPDLEAMQKVFAGRRFRVMAVSIEDDRDSVARFYRHHALSIPLYFDASGLVHGASGIPDTYVVDQKGILLKRYVGAQKWTGPEMIATIEAWLTD